MDTTSLSVAQQESLAHRQEDQFFDRKSRLIQPAKIGKPLSAFSNTDGGELIIGIEDDGRWNGFQSVEDANAVIDIVHRTLAPGYFQVDLLRSESDQTLAVLVIVQRSPGVLATTSGEVYVRRGAASVPVRGDELDELRRAKGVISYENQGLVYEVEELANSEQSIEFCLSAVPLLEPETYLRKQGLITMQARPTVGGTLLFHDEPQVHLPKAGVKVYRYKTLGAPERRYLDGLPETIDGSIYAQIARAVRRTTEIIAAIPMLTEAGMRGILYPPEALHEILTNAVLHRDYAINDDVHVRIFDSRVEVESPGRLPAHITPQNILDERFARNPTIVRLLSRFPDPPNMDVGEGLNTAFQAMEALRLQRPEIAELDNKVLVTIRHEPLASAENAIMDFVREHGSINNTEARGATGIEQERTIRRYFEQLVSTGELIREGQARGTKYRLPEN